MSTSQKSFPIGGQLKSEREENSLSIEELSRSTRIPVATLLRLEEERFDELPGDLFVRGFLKSYAEAVGIDSAGIVERFDSSRPPPPNGIDIDVARRHATIARRPLHLPIALATATFLTLIAVVFAMLRQPTNHEKAIELSSLSPWQLELSQPMQSCSELSTTVKPIASSRC